MGNISEELLHGEYLRANLVCELLGRSAETDLIAVYGLFILRGHVLESRAHVLPMEPYSHILFKSSDRKLVILYQ